MIADAVRVAPSTGAPLIATVGSMALLAAAAEAVRVKGSLATPLSYAITASRPKSVPANDGVAATRIPRTLASPEPTTKVGAVK